MAFVNSTGKITADAQKAGTSTTTLGWTPTIGNHLIVEVVGWSLHPAGGMRLTSVSDLQSNTYAIDISQFDGGPGDVQAAICSAKVAGTQASLVVTLHFPVEPTSGEYITWCVSEFSGLPSTSWLDQTGTAQQANVANISVNASGANAQASELVVAVAVNGGASTNVHFTTATTGYTERFIEQSNDHTPGEGADKIVGSIETSAAAWTFDAPGVGFGNAAVIATYILTTVPDFALDPIIKVISHGPITRNVGY